MHAGGRHPPAPGRHPRALIARPERGPRLCAMTPRQADVAFALEDVPGFRRAYAIAPNRPAARHFDFAVELEQNGRALAAVHYALCRVMTHEACARVFFFYSQAPPIIAVAATPLWLTDDERTAARRRAPPPRPAAPSPLRPRDLDVLVVDDDPEVLRIVREAIGGAARWAHARDVSDAVDRATRRSFDLVLCDARRAFGSHGLLAQLPLEVATRVLVLAEPCDVADARWRLQGTERIITKPLETWIVQQRFLRAREIEPEWRRELGGGALESPPATRRRLRCPPPSASFSALLVDLDDETHEILRAAVRHDARHVMRREPDEGAELALSSPFHAVVCSARAALHARSILDGIAREDPAGADRVLVVAAARDVPWVTHELGKMRRRNKVIAAPIDEALLRREILRDHPSLAVNAAARDVLEVDASRVGRPRFRRLAVLVVDDDVSTAILFDAASPRDDADVSLATTTMEAFEHLTTRAVDVLIVSATMRGDGGEPLYRVLWRLEPALKSRCVLVTPPDALPPSAPRARIVERPLTREAIGGVVRAFAR
ncbi:MAG: hypothetical protein KF819_40460 [Labilithrix sp.]|nr:hypothetical protein [Labilithrix sp.]